MVTKLYLFFELSIAFVKKMRTLPKEYICNFSINLSPDVKEP